MQNIKRPLARKDGLVVQEMPEEVLVYDTNTDKAHCLNLTAAMIWKHCDGNNEISDITQILSRELNAPVKDELVWLALDQLEKENLLEQQQAFSLSAFGKSRRDLIKNIGVMSLSLPIVTSMIHQSASSKQDGCDTTVMCNVLADCTPAGVCGACKSGFCSL